jgi:hypothetical protein
MARLFRAGIRGDEISLMKSRRSRLGRPCCNLEIKVDLRKFLRNIQPGVDAGCSV